MIKAESVANYEKETGMRTLFTLHAPSKNLTSEAYLKKKVRDHLESGFNVTNIEFLETIPWTYLPR